MPHGHVVKKINTDLLVLFPRVIGGGVSVGKLFSTMLLHFAIPFNFLYAT